ncbi:MAG: type II secretion system F family protein [Candidatus Omnitrophica bacterium]|nr:type II secretion system F family protein [Candidatus Omnitrophota bacterium]
MGLFQYKARDKFNKPINGVLSASSIDLVAVKLKSQGYTPISIVSQEEKIEAANVDTASTGTRVPFAEVTAFTRQCYTLQKAGIPILSAMRSVKEQARNPFFKKVVTQIATDIESGLEFRICDLDDSDHPSIC